MAALKTLIVIPIFNEESHVPSLLSHFPVEGCDLLIVDDASTDQTSQRLQENKIQVLRHAQRSGVGKCLQDGIGWAKTQGYDVLVVMAGNGKDNPQEIPRLLSAIEQGKQYVQGSRFMTGGSWRNLPWKRWAAIKLFTSLWSLCLQTRLTDVTNGFRAYRLSLLDDPDIRWQQQWLQTYEFEYYLHYKALRKRVPFCEVPVSKNYPTQKNYSKIRPGLDWWKIVRPLFLLMTGLKK